MQAHVGGLDLDVTDAKSKLQERQSFESDSSRWSHATTKLEDDNGVEEDNGGVGEDNGEVEEEASNEQSVNGSPSNPHEQRAPLASPRWCVTPEQRKKLEAFLEQVPLPSHAACQLLAVKMGVSPQQIEDWFSDRRRLLAAQGMASAWDGVDDPFVRTTCGARTSLQTQLHKAVPFRSRFSAA
jgi:hypothetical protein